MRICPQMRAALLQDRTRPAREPARSRARVLPAARVREPAFSRARASAVRARGPVRSRARASAARARVQEGLPQVPAITAAESVIRTVPVLRARAASGRSAAVTSPAQGTEEEKIKSITIPETLTIKELADLLKIQPTVIIKKLFMQGKMVTVNEEIDYDTAEEIAMDYDVLCEKEVKVNVIEELLKDTEDPEESLRPVRLLSA